MSLLCRDVDLLGGERISKIKKSVFVGLTVGLFNSAGMFTKQRADCSFRCLLNVFVLISSQPS